MLDALRLSVVVAVSTALAGCAAGPKHNPPPPADWAKASLTRIGACPSIAGVYEGKGQLALESGVLCLVPRASTTAGEWQCSDALTVNLGLASPLAHAVELRQPDGDTLEVVRRDDKGEAVEAHTLTRGKDFSCDDDSLYFSGTASAIPGALGVMGAFFLTGGVQNHTRAFTRDADGGLVMTVRSSEVFVYLGLPFGGSATSHMRWRPANLAGGGTK